MAYLMACQKSAYKTYSGPSRDLFAEIHYFHPTIMAYWMSLAQNNGSKHWWVAELHAPQKQIVGGIGLRIGDDHSQGYGFYVTPERQSQGIGRSLWLARQEFIRGPLLFEVYSQAVGTIAQHLKHGARLTGNQRLIHWESWPQGVSLNALEFIAS